MLKLVEVVAIVRTNNILLILKYIEAAEVTQTEQDTKERQDLSEELDETIRALTAEIKVLYFFIVY